MRSVSITTNCRNFLLISVIFLMKYGIVSAQENSPYSRFGLGDVVPSQNILNRAMGGVAAAYYDPVSVNFINPASYARLKYTTFDVGVDYSIRTLKAVDPVRSHNSSYLIPSYLQVGIPLSKKRNWGMNIGLRPITRINYDLKEASRLPGIDSVLTSYTGNGGSYQIYAGTGIGSKHFTIGVNAGYEFGRKNYITERIFLNDSVLYEKGKWADSTYFGGFFIHSGVQYSTRINKTMTLKLGAFAQLKNSMNATREIIRQTFEYTASSGHIQKDSVYVATDKGKITLPATYGLGFSIEKDLQWAISAEYSMTQWAEYRYFDQPDDVKDSWVFRLGGSFIPNYKSPGYWSQIQYRAGFYIGPDYITVNDNLPIYAVTFGASLPVRKYGYSVYSGQYTSINTAFEIGSRGNKSNSLRENFYRISIGLCLSDIWFIKRTYQ